MGDLPRGGIIARAARTIRSVAALKIPLHAANAGFFIVLSVFPALLLMLSLLRYTRLEVGDLLELAGKHDVRLIVNRVEKTMLSILDKTIDDVMDEAGLPLLGVVLEDPDVPMAAACGKCLARYNKRSPAVKSFQRIAKRIQGFPEPIKIR